MKIKFIKKILSLIIFIISFIIIIFLLILKPFGNFRIGIINTDRIGRLAPDVNSYILSKKLSKKKYIDFIFQKGFVANYFLYNKWKKIIKIYNNKIRIEKIIFFINKIYPKNDLIVPLGDNSNIFYLFNNFKEVDVHFTHDELKFCEEQLSKINIDTNKIMCFHNRDSQYLNKYFDSDWSHHNKRDFPVETFNSVLNYLSSQEYSCIRLGEIANSKINIQSNSIFDYVNSNIRSDILDLYISYISKFYLGSDSGIWTLPLIFRKPILMINSTSPKNFVTKNYKPFFYIPKNIFNKSTDKFLKLSEMIELERNEYTKNLQDLVFCNNTEEDVCEFTQEFLNFEKNKFEDLDIDYHKIQNEVLKIYSKYYNFDINKIKPRIGYSFIKKYNFLID